jgi:hydroxymethylpyrimidine/phosphomethylpyrimidine kinase
MPRPRQKPCNMSDAVPPCVLIISGNDPSGGAGIAADLQAVSALGAHPAPVITALTVQDTVNAWRVDPVDPGLVAEQARAVLADLPVAAVKIGLLADARIGAAVAEVLEEHPGPRVVLDPVLVAAGGAELAERDIEDVMMDRLFPLATVVTPNALELRRLGGEDGDRASRARRLLDTGAGWILAKGADEDTPGVDNVLFGPGDFMEVSRWRRLPGDYHGSGCTLAAAISAFLAAGAAVQRAVAEAQKYTYECLLQAYRPGRGQFVPRRLHETPDPGNA